MKVLGTRGESFLYLHGLAVPSPIRLHEGVELIPAGRPSLDSSLLEGMEKDEDRAVLMLFLPRVSSQLRISGANAKETAVRAWNGFWDAILVGALAGCEVTCNLQSTVSIEDLCKTSKIHVTNHHLRGMRGWPPLMLTEDQLAWLQTHFLSARALMSEDNYRDAVHALASYKWHSLPRAQLAMLWAGIEGLFGVDSEITFKLSLGVAKFLGENPVQQRLIFQSTRSLYRARSKAVHGGKIKADAGSAISESAGLLNRLLLKSAEIGRLPDIEQLVI